VVAHLLYKPPLLPHRGLGTFWGEVCGIG